MLERRIKISAIEEAQDLVWEASKCDFDIDIFYNSVIIDAKSILGVLSLDFANILTVKCFGKNEEFERFLDRYAVA